MGIIYQLGEPAGSLIPMIGSCVMQVACNDQERPKAQGWAIGAYISEVNSLYPSSKFHYVFLAIRCNHLYP